MNESSEWIPMFALPNVAAQAAVEFDRMVLVRDPVRHIVIVYAIHKPATTPWHVLNLTSASLG